MNEIKLNDKTVALFHKNNEWKKGLDFLTTNDAFIQTGTWWYDNGQVLKAHRHILNERNVNLTQETFIVLCGRLRVDLYDESNNVFHKEILTAGDLGIILSCGHGYVILEDNTKVVEVKNGPFVSVEKDKELIIT
ncbi:MAG: hypothetical protein ABSD46_03650 [Bacteroidota bacterium]